MSDLAAVGTHRVLSRGLTETLRWFLYAGAAIAAASAYVVGTEASRFGLWWEGRSPVALDRFLRAEEASAAALGFFLLVSLVIGVLTIMWWYQAYHIIERVGVTGRSWSSGWAIGGWFIPFASLIIPKLVLNEIDRVSAVAEDGAADWRATPLLGLANWWWIFWVAGSIAFGAGVVLAQAQLEAVGFEGDVYRTALRLEMVGLAAMAVASLLGAAALRVIGSRLTPPR